MADVFWGAESSPLNETTVIGTCVIPTPDTSTLNCAQAGCVMKQHMAAKSNNKRLKEVRKVEEWFIRIDKVEATALI
jgi:hypothetical protein